MDIDLVENINQYDSKGKKYGLWRFYYMNPGNLDTLWCEPNYVNGELHGLFKSWHLNGQLCSEVNYVNDERHGLYRLLNEDGELVDEMYYVNGILEGEQIEYEY